MRGVTLTSYSVPPVRPVMVYVLVLEAVVRMCVFVPS